MKIVRVIARLNVGGPAKHVIWLAKGLQSSDCQIVLVSGSVPPGEEDMSYFAGEMGVSPFFIPEMSREISVKDAITIWKLFQLFRRERPDIIHTHTAKAGTVGRMAAFLYRWLTPSILVAGRRRPRLVHTYHGHIFHSYYGSLKTRVFLTIEKILARVVTDRIVVISEQQRREISEEFGVGSPDQFSVIPLGLDLDVFADWAERGQAFRDECGVNANDALIGIVGRLTEIKNHELFLEAAAKLKAQLQSSGKSIKFAVVGDGALRKQLEDKASFLGLATDVVFTGTRRDVENIYPALDIVALSSLNEGTPLTLIEAMANGRSVVSTAVGGVVDLVGEPVSPQPAKSFKVCPRGITVASNDPQALADGLAYLVADPELRREIGKRGLQFVVSRYSNKRLLEDIRALYAQLLSEDVGSMRSQTSDGLKSRVNP